ncbi:hypothetical protein ES705_28907 [subsurface metagenome]
MVAENTKFATRVEQRWRATRARSNGVRQGRGTGNLPSPAFLFFLNLIESGQGHGTGVTQSLKVKRVKMKVCPRCRKLKMRDEQALNSLSRRGDVYICNDCGDEEARIDMKIMSLTEIEKRFVAELNLPSPPKR